MSSTKSSATLAILTFFLAIIYVDTAEVKYKDCGSPAGIIKSITVDPCDDPSNIRLRKGHSAVVAVTFIPKKRTTSVKVVVQGMVYGMTYTLGLPNPDGCKNSGLVCDLIENREATYRTVIPIKDSYPKLNIGIRLMLKDQDGTNLVCAEMKGRITN
uniref:ML domain-containing protein n=1 Tax=Trichuris muris TaxID=70415 RepID=A0A5S6R0L2_TRIMR